MKLVYALLAAVALSGCQGPPAEAKAAKDADTAKLTTLEAPKLDDKELSSTDIGLVRDGESVHVGEDPDKAFKTLLNNRSGGFINERLPDGFQKPYETKVWQGAEDAFGVVSYNKKVVAAMYQESRADRERANTVRQAYAKLMNDVEPQTIAGEKVTYYFWNKTIDVDGEKVGQRLMIMVFQATNRPVFIATAMGDNRVMDALGMNETQARLDQVSADKMLGRMEANQNGGKS